MLHVTVLVFPLGQCIVFTSKVCSGGEMGRIPARHPTEESVLLGYDPDI